MKKQFLNLTEITDKETFTKVRTYFEELIQYATKNGYLAKQDANNEYTQELTRIAEMLAEYESLFMDLSPLKFKSPLIITIEKEMQKKKLNQRQTAELLEIKENTFSQVMTGKRNVSMKLAKKLYEKLRIDPKTILEFS
ncbi:MAG: helix-turn-helix transcriptional regulator [Flavobacteriaceae bacterium]